ncbi:hypothetical protein Bca4012_096261 [Brassica carinata]
MASGCSDRGGARSGHIESGSGAAVSRVKRWSLVGSAFRVLLSSSVRAVLLWSRQLPVKRRWRVTVCLTLWMRIWRLVSPCRPLFQICNEGVDVVTIGAVLACEMLYVFYRSRELQSLSLEAHRGSYGGRVFTELSLAMCVLFLSGDRKESSMVWSEKGREVLLLCSSSVATLARSRLIRRSCFFGSRRQVMTVLLLFRVVCGRARRTNGSKLSVNGAMTSTRFSPAMKLLSRSPQIHGEE